MAPRRKPPVPPLELPPPPPPRQKPRKRTEPKPVNIVADEESPPPPPPPPLKDDTSDFESDAETVDSSPPPRPPTPPPQPQPPPPPLKQQTLMSSYNATYKATIIRLLREDPQVQETLADAILRMNGNNPQIQDTIKRSILGMEWRDSTVRANIKANVLRLLQEDGEVRDAVMALATTVALHSRGRSRAKLAEEAALPQPPPQPHPQPTDEPLPFEKRILAFLRANTQTALSYEEFSNQSEVTDADLECILQEGFVDGFTKLILRNLDNLELSQRPIVSFKRDLTGVYIKVSPTKWKRDAALPISHSTSSHCTKKGNKVGVEDAECGGGGDGFAVGGGSEARRVERPGGEAPLRPEAVEVKGGFNAHATSVAFASSRQSTGTIGSNKFEYLSEMVFDFAQKVDIKIVEMRGIGAPDGWTPEAWNDRLDRIRKQASGGIDRIRLIGDICRGVAEGVFVDI